MAAIVLLSAGLDSTVNLKRAADETGVALALTFDYGQRAAARETAAASRMCDRLAIPHRTVHLPWLAEVSTDALGSAADIPEVTADSLNDAGVSGGETARAVWVPNRNGVFVSIAAAFAEALRADTIVAGFNAEEAATFPDNSEEFVAAANALLRLSTMRRPVLLSYTQDLTKQKIAALGRDIGAPIESVWSCYRGGPEHCWGCESCARLERALRGADLWAWFHEHRDLP